MTCQERTDRIRRRGHGSFQTIRRRFHSPLLATGRGSTDTMIGAARWSGHRLRHMRMGFGSQPMRSSRSLALAAEHRQPPGGSRRSARRSAPRVEQCNDDFIPRGRPRRPRPSKLLESAMIACAGVTKREIRLHYDLATPFYRLLWGPHIHHGMWDARRAAAPGPATAHRTTRVRGVDRRRRAGPGRWLRHGRQLHRAGQALRLPRDGPDAQPGTARCGAQSRRYGTARPTHALPVRRRRDGSPSRPPDSTWYGTSSAASISSTRPRSSKGRPVGCGRAGGVALCAWLAGDGPDR